MRLAADEDKTVATAYGVWVEKSMYGRKYMGVERSTFLIDKSGRIAKSWRKVKVPGHAEEVLAAAQGRWPSRDHAHPAWPMMYRTLALRRTPFSVRAQPRAEIPA